LFGQGEVAAVSQPTNKEGDMRTKKQLIVCLTVCLVLSFVSAVYAGTNVTIDNSNLAPVPVTEVKQQPIAKELTVKICGNCGLNCAPGCSFLSQGWFGNGTIYNVPIGKSLVIEYFSCKNISVNGSSFGSYGTSYSCFISPRTSGVSVDHYLPTTPYGHGEIFPISDTGEAGPANPPAFLSAGQRVQLYADPGSDVVVGVYRQRNLYMPWSWNYDEYMYFSFSGYLLDEVIVPIIEIRNPKK
jgi:hypothetical protein